MRHDDRGVALSLTIGALKNDIACRLVTMPVDPGARLHGKRSDLLVPRRYRCDGCDLSIGEMNPNERRRPRHAFLDAKRQSQIIVEPTSRQAPFTRDLPNTVQIVRASCRERVCHYV